MVNSISTSSGELNREMLLEALSKRNEKKVYSSSDSNSQQAEEVTQLSDISFEDIMEKMSMHGKKPELPSNVDTDEDGTLSLDKYDLMIEDMGIEAAMTGEEFFAAYDTNEDGEITPDEMPEPGSVKPKMETSDLTDLFQNYDTDEDGVISPEEFEEMISSDSDLLMQRMAMNMVRAYEDNIGYSSESDESSVLDSIA